MADYSGHEGSCYRRHHSRGNYGYRGSSSKLTYSLAMPKSYGNDIDLDSYLGKSKQGLSGYVNAFLKNAKLDSVFGGVYPKHRQNNLYKFLDKNIRYNTKLQKANLPPYDLSSMRRPVFDLEEALN